MKSQTERRLNELGIIGHDDAILDQPITASNDQV
jgi:hypothetical protein